MQNLKSQCCVQAGKNVIRCFGARGALWLGKFRSDCSWQKCSHQPASYTFVGEHRPSLPTHLLESIDPGVRWTSGCTAINYQPFYCLVSFCIIFTTQTRDAECRWKFIPSVETFSNCASIIYIYTKLLSLSNSNVT